MGWTSGFPEITETWHEGKNGSTNLIYKILYFEFFYKFWYEGCEVESAEFFLKGRKIHTGFLR